MTPLTLIIGNKNYSSWSLRPWLLMKQFDVAFDEIYIPLYTPDTTAKILAHCPAGNGKVPILRHESHTIWDSLAIFEYLIERFPERSWLPKDPAARAVALSLCAEMHSGFLALRHAMPMNCRATLLGQAISEDVQKEVDRVVTIWSTCRQNYGSEGNLLFGRFTVADAMFAPVVLRFRTYGVPLSPICQVYADAIVALPAVQEWLSAAEIEAESIPAFEL